MGNRLVYHDVLDVALRATLKDRGFTRKTQRDFVREQPGRIWYFEVEMARNPAPGFEVWAAIFLPELQAIIDKFAPGYFGHQAATHNFAHIWAPLIELIGIATGSEVRAPVKSSRSEEAAERERLAQVVPAMKYRASSGWIVPDYVRGYGLSDSEHRRRWDCGIRELGLFLDEQFRDHIWKWYWNCNDLLFVIDWIENHEIMGNNSDVTMGILCHLAGDDAKAAAYLQKRIDGGRRTYAEIYRSSYKRNHPNWLQRLWTGQRGWSEQKIAEGARLSLQYQAEMADAARKIADGLGTRVD